MATGLGLGDVIIGGVTPSCRPASMNGVTGNPDVPGNGVILIVLRLASRLDRLHVSSLTALSRPRRSLE
jgi:hypothetical protein